MNEDASPLPVFEGVNSGGNRNSRVDCQSSNNVISRDRQISNTSKWQRTGVAKVGRAF